MSKLRIVSAFLGAATVLGAGAAYAGEIPIRPLGRVESSGGSYIQLDGYDTSPLVQAHPWAAGYVSLGRDGVCAGGANDHSYYAQPGNESSQDCNEQLFDEENRGYLLNP